jgi:hypothetical protein
LANSFIETKYTSAGKGGAVVKSFADQVDEAGDVAGRDGVHTGAKDIQGLAVAEEDRRLPIADNDLGTNAIIANAGIVRETTHDFIDHLISIFNNIKDTRHALLL